MLNYRYNDFRLIYKFDPGLDSLDELRIYIYLNLLPIQNSDNQNKLIVNQLINDFLTHVVSKSNGFFYLISITKLYSNAINRKAIDRDNFFSFIYSIPNDNYINKITVQKFSSNLNLFDVLQQVVKTPNTFILNSVNDLDEIKKEFSKNRLDSFQSMAFQLVLNKSGFLAKTEGSKIYGFLAFLIYSNASIE